MCEFEILDEKGVASKLEELSKLGGTARFAVAFWGKDAESLVHLDGYDEVQIICNLHSGATNPTLIRKLLERYDVLQLDKLHAKLYWTPHGVIIGSSNASANGLCMGGPETRSLHEVNVFSSDRDFIKEAKKLFDVLWNKSTLITKKDLEIAQEEYSKRKSPRKRRSRRSQRSLLRNAHRVDSSIWVCVYNDDEFVSDEAEKTFDEAKKELGVKFPGLFCYEEDSEAQRLEPETVAIYLPIRTTKGKPGIRAVGVEFYQVLPKEYQPHRRLKRGKGRGAFIQLVRPLKKVPRTDLKILKEDVEIWKEAAELCWLEHPSSHKPNGEIDMHLRDFSKYIHRAAALV